MFPQVTASAPPLENDMEVSYPKQPALPKEQVIWDLLNSSVVIEDKIASQLLYQNLSREIQDSSFKDFLVDNRVLTHLHQFIQRTPLHAREQCQLALALAKYYWNSAQLTLSSNFSSNFQQFDQGLDFCRSGMKHAGKAIQIAKAHQLPDLWALSHLQSTTLFLMTGAHFFRYHLVDAISEGQPTILYEILKRLEEYGKLCTNSEQLECFFTAANSALKGKGSDANYQNSFQFLEKLKASKNAIPLSGEIFTQKYEQALQQFRKAFENPSLQDDVRDFQDQISLQFRKLFLVFINDCLLFTGKLPCEFDIRALGSAARKEVSPFSDLEFMLLIQDNEFRTFFICLIKLLEIQVCSLGETTDDFVIVYSSINGEHNPSGFHLDTAGNPARENSLLGEPKTVAALQKARVEAANSPQYTSLKSISLYTSNEGLFREFMDEVDSVTPIEKRQERLHQLLSKQLDLDFADIQNFYEKERVTIINLKKMHMGALFHTIGCLGLLFGIDSHNTFDIIQALTDKKIFTVPTGRFLRKASLAIYQLKARLQIYYNQECDILTTAPTVNNLFYDPKVLSYLEKIYWVGIKPLINLLKEACKKGSDALIQLSQVDIFVKAIEETIEVSKTKPSNFVKKTIIHISEALASVEDNYKFHIACYNLLAKHDPETDQYRAWYLKPLKGEIHEKLSAIPTPNGQRQDYVRKERTLDHLLLAITEENGDPNFQVKVSKSSWEYPRYLTRDSIDTLINPSTGLLKEDQLEFLKFEAKPTNILTEFCIQTLSHRIGGKAFTPLSDFIKFEVQLGSIKQSYLVRVYENIEGKTLDKIAPPAWENCAQDEWTWAFLLSILLRPGSGTPSNYLMTKNGSVMSLSNTHSFVEPVVNVEEKAKIQFLSALFYYFPQATLHRETLETFAQLKPKKILDTWIDEVILKQKEYELFFEEDTEERLKLLLLFKERGVKTLLLQFYRLRAFVSEALNKDLAIRVQDLLGEVINLNPTGHIEIIGPLIQKYYYSTEMQNLNIEQCLSILLEGFITDSIKPKDLPVPGLGTFVKNLFIPAAPLKTEKYLYIPLLEDIKQKPYVSATEAKLELAESFSKKLVMDFAQIPLDSQRKYLDILVNNAQVLKPRSISIQNCQFLDLATFQKLLHKDVLFIDFSYCSKICAMHIVAIQNACPLLEELRLVGCKDLDNVALTYRFSSTTDPINFPQLKRLFVDACPKLIYITLAAPFIASVSAKDCKSLVRVELQPLSLTVKDATVNVSQCPRLDNLTGLMYDKENAIKQLERDWSKIKLVRHNLNNDPDVALAALKNQNEAFLYISKELQDDADFFRAGLEREPLIWLPTDKQEKFWSASHSYQFASPRLRAMPDILISAAIHHPDALMHAPKHLLSDEKMIHRIMNANAEGFRYIPKELRDNLTIARTAIRQNGRLIQYVSDRLKNERSLALEAIRENAQCIKHLPKKFLDDEEIIRTAINVDGTLFKYASQRLKNNFNLANQAVKQNPEAMEHASTLVAKLLAGDVSALEKAPEEVRNSPHQMTRFVEKDGMALKYAGKEVKDNFNVVRAAIIQNPLAIAHASNHLKGNRNLAVYAVSKKGAAYKYFSEDLQRDPEVIFKALRNNLSVIQLLPKDLKSDKEFVYKMVKLSGLLLEHASELLKNDREIVQAAYVQNCQAIKFASPSLRSKKEFMLGLIDIDSYAIRYVNDSLWENEEFALKAYQKSKEALQYFSNELLANKKFILRAVRLHARALASASSTLRSNRAFILQCVKLRGTCLRHALLKFRQDVEICRTAIKQNPKALKYVSGTELKQKLSK